ncbi:MAG: Cytosol aminopeptidase PepA (EC [uncultured Sulfurovum sp.]|uniref:Probable cytosol aminopeptidase n=1 Tax=uncultured Sulfurovum sp. TaxID=269237 RepID=A0A6S6TKZ2_9BACT|nr:MAG: Cytosol aminopeptidase PepA (EC [uncultured Sulfurovum sp.]
MRNKKEPNMNFELTISPINEIDAPLELIVIVNKNFKHDFVQDKKLLKKSGFKAEQDATYLLITKNRLYVAVESINDDNLRVAMAKAIQALSATKYKRLKIASYLENDKAYSNLRAMVEGLLLGAYAFDTYKTSKAKQPIKDIIISLEEYNGLELDIEEAAMAVELGQITADATNFTRDIVNMTPEDCYPKTLANIAKGLSEEFALGCNILKPKQLREENMETLLAVARASRHKPRVIHLSHKPKNPKAVISLIGKGLTYDSGGLSLKPGASMVNMKLDKSGACAVLGIMKAVAEMNLAVEVHGFIGAVENMIGGDAYKPDDVLVAKNGKTIEVRNTDAEGRLVLADTLGYAQQEVEADYMFDFATLTGASVVAVGHYTSTVMGNADLPRDMVIEAAKASGELATKLDFNKHLRSCLKSNVADISNMSNTSYGGAITAGIFLDNFIEEKNKDKWAHIDIAGPAYVEHTWGENPIGGSGVGVRMMIRLLEKLAVK